MSAPYKINGMRMGYPTKGGLFVVFRGSRHTASVAQVWKDKFRWLTTGGKGELRKSGWMDEIAWDELKWSWFGLHGVTVEKWKQYAPHAEPHSKN